MTNFIICVSVFCHVLVALYAKQSRGCITYWVNNNDVSLF